MQGSSLTLWAGAGCPPPASPPQELSCPPLDTGFLTDPSAPVSPTKVRSPGRPGCICVPSAPWRAWPGAGAPRPLECMRIFLDLSKRVFPHKRKLESHWGLFWLIFNIMKLHPWCLLRTPGLAFRLLREKHLSERLFSEEFLQFKDSLFRSPLSASFGDIF